MIAQDSADDEISQLKEMVKERDEMIETLEARLEEVEEDSRCVCDHKFRRGCPEHDS